ncbi:16S rRNA (guanine(966)-N(2))-methyltransferase RsmD [Piscinibacter sp. SJAQ100]|uniref:16S rRNA (Guanine(966)-N(2))-methyltransferase RsmD n=1 Tax=Aquariibacter albus TaxID=2759899 RepID=A0A839HRB2_9BURK|nr:16S rRNA (guanine(966)-N(2))-methyltransferase RsmD [Aquariibacter albus]
MRLIGGRWKRRKLPVPDAPGLRPTPDRVRETLFNWLGQTLDGWRVLDAFAGSGALGFEAASRGAAEVRLLEQDPRLVRGLQASARLLDPSPGNPLRIEAADACAWMRTAAPASRELVLLDPPFHQGLDRAALALARPLLAPQGWIYLESERAWPDAELAALGLRLHRQLRAGAVHAHLLQAVEPGGPGPTLPA